MLRSLLIVPLSLTIGGCSLFFNSGEEEWDEDDADGVGEEDGGSSDGDGGSGSGDGGSGSGDGESGSSGSGSSGSGSSGSGSSGSGSSGGSGGSGGSGSGGSGSSDYTSYDGYEVFEYSGGGSSGARSCVLEWSAEGSPSSAAGACADCEFVFDVDMSYLSSSTDDGTCADLAGDGSYTYGYQSDYSGYGPYVMYYSPSYGSFSAWASANFSGGTLSYSYGYEDWDYYGNGTYYTYLWAGEADID